MNSNEQMVVDFERKLQILAKNYESIEPECAALFACVGAMDIITMVDEIKRGLHAGDKHVSVALWNRVAELTGLDRAERRAELLAAIGC